VPAKGAAWQEMVTGIQRGYEYYVKSPLTGKPVKFDSWVQDTKTLIDAKENYDGSFWLNPDGSPTRFFKDNLLEEAQRQYWPGTEYNWEWIFNNDRAATAAAKLFQDNELDIKATVPDQAGGYSQYYGDGSYTTYAADGTSTYTSSNGYTY
jgi:hypothetical protein